VLDRDYFVYLLASRPNGTLYVGVTNDLVRRVWQHKQGLVEGFTKKYGVTVLVWFEYTESIDAAITREKQIKKWDRKWKIELIRKSNPAWRDLYPEITALVDSRVRGNDTSNSETP
jgi:putative endonuclease